MIQCGKCKYIVPSNLKYSIMNNVCPSCGDVLFGDSDMVEIKAISQNILHQEFSDGMNKVLVNDIALFIFNEYVKHNSYSANTESDGDDSSDLSKASSDSSDESVLEKIRDEVRSEILPEHSFSEELEDEDEDKKIARLKRLARDAGLKSNRGTSVKRVT